MNYFKLSRIFFLNKSNPAPAVHCTLNHLYSVNIFFKKAIFPIKGKKHFFNLDISPYIKKLSRNSFPNS